MQNHDTIIYAHLQLYIIVDVKNDVIIAPPMFPALGQEHHNPIRVPRPLFPNQFANMTEHAGQPMDWRNPLIEKRAHMKSRFMKPISAESPMRVATTDTSR